MRELTCAVMNCGYYYKTEEDKYPRCHYPDDDVFCAPCEYEDEEAVGDYV